jgi:hypothetical protein
MSELDHIALALVALAASTGDVSPEVRLLHLGVARTSATKAKEKLAALEISLKAHEAAAAIDGLAR